MLKHIFCFNAMLLVLLILSCGKSGPATPDYLLPDRELGDFAPAVQLFGFDVECSDADVAEILQGPGYESESYWGTPFYYNNPSGENWAVGVTRCVSGNDYAVQYRFMGEGTDSTNLGPILYCKDDEDVTITGDIRFPRVASCFFRKLDYMNDTNHTFVEVTVVFQYRENVNDDWSIRTVRMGFDRNDFGDDLSDIEPVWSYDVTLGIGNWYGDQMPDVAYDPRNAEGDLHVVFTRWIDAAVTTN